MNAASKLSENDFEQSLSHQEGVNNVLVVGVSFRSASVDFREQIAVSSDERSTLLRELCDGVCIAEAMIVSTCNRVEFYIYAYDVETAFSRIVSLFQSRSEGENVEPYLYQHRGEDALLHLFRVTSSLDSLVIGEPQILGQIKEAFEASLLANAVHNVLHRSLQHALFTAKKVRTETALGVGQVSIASVAVDLARQIYGELNACKVLLLGAGEIAEASASALYHAGATHLMIANRSIERAKSLAHSLEQISTSLRISVHSIQELTNQLEHADVVLVSTGAHSYIITKDVVLSAIKKRRGRPLFLIDISVPRNVDPDIHSLENCYRYDIDDLEHIAAEGVSLRQQETRAAAALVQEEVEKFVFQEQQQKVVPTLVALREHVRTIFYNEFQKSLSGKLRNLNEDERKALEAMINAAINKLLHMPTQLLKKNVNNGQHFIHLVHQLFNLSIDEPNANSEDTQTKRLK